MSEIAQETTEPEQIPVTGTTTPNSSDSPNDAQVDAAFNAESLELSFGLPPGSLKDVKDEASALEAVRNFTDKVLTAGLAVGTNTRVSDEPVTSDTAVSKKQPAEKKEGEQKSAASAELDAMRAELAEVKGYLAEQQRQHQNQLLAEVDRRLAAEVDSWESAKFGVTGSRNYNQTKAFKQLRDELIPNYLGGAQATGLSIPTIEVVARNVRVHTDDTYKPGQNKADTSQAMGTPGTRKEANDKAAPKNIHEALLRNAS